MEFTHYRLFENWEIELAHELLNDILERDLVLITAMIDGMGSVGRVSLLVKSFRRRVIKLLLLGH